jgi:hypothetical protein
MSRTRADLVNRVLQKLGAWEVGQEPSPERYALVDGELPSTLATLSRTGLYTVNNIERIADEAFSPLAVLVAFDLKSEFAVSGDELLSLTAEAARAEGALYTITSSGPDETILRADYY